MIVTSCHATNLHLVLQLSHVSLLHQLVERYEFPKALPDRHDLRLLGQVKGQLQGRVQPHLLYTAKQVTNCNSAQKRLNRKCLPAGHGPDQLEDVVDQAGAVVAAQGCVVVMQQGDDGVPALGAIVDHVVAAHVDVELHPVHLLWQVQHI